MILRPPGRSGSAFLSCMVAALLAVAATPAAASQLDEGTCKKLQAERQGLAVLGVDKNLEKGADWAKANLKPADISLVKRYLELYEQLKFRCEKVIALSEPDEGDDDGEEAGAKDAAPMPERREPLDEKSSALEEEKPASGSAAAAEMPQGATVSVKATKGDMETGAVKSAKARGTADAGGVKIGPARTVPTDR
jgi:hypothetical protein